MATITKFHNWRQGQEDGSAVFDWDADNIKIMLVDNGAAAPPAQTLTTITELLATAATEMADGNGYTTDGATIATIDVTRVDELTTVGDNATDVTWLQNDPLGFETARYAIIYKNTGTGPATGPLMGFINFTTDKGNVSGDLAIQWNTAGIFTVS